jgi:hypothetical protein
LLPLSFELEEKIKNKIIHLGLLKEPYY